MYYRESIEIKVYDIISSSRGRHSPEYCEFEIHRVKEDNRGQVECFCAYYVVCNVRMIIIEDSEYHSYPDLF
jgi:hypothetical protein